MDLKDAMKPGYNKGLVNLRKDIAELELSAAGLELLGKRNQKPQGCRGHLLHSGKVDEDSQAGTPLDQASQLLADLGNDLLFSNSPIGELDDKDVVPGGNNQTREFLRHPEPFGTRQRARRETIRGLRPVGI